MKFNNVLETTGNTPVIRLSKLFPHNEVYIKDERRNPGGSIKDRIALAMIEAAEKSKLLGPGGTIIEPTSGNTGIGLAMAGTYKGYKVILVMPESMSMERRKILKAYGAELILTPREKGMSGAVVRAKEIADTIPGSWIPMQFDNPANPAIHKEVTAKEIVSDFPDGIDFFVTGVGTGGHITGIGEVLKIHFPWIRIIAVEPSDSPVLSGGKSGAHQIQGIGAGFIPHNYSPGIASQIFKISGQDAFNMARELALKEGILAGISTGASLAAVSTLLETADVKTKVLTIAYDAGDRYLSVPGLWTD